MAANYKTGTITIDGTAVIAGGGTAWQTAGVRQGAPIAFKDNLYYVQSVDSETQITLTGAVSEDPEAGVVYTIGLDFDPYIGTPRVNTNDEQWPVLLAATQDRQGREIVRRNSTLAYVFYDFNDSKNGFTGWNCTLETQSDVGAIPASAMRATITGDGAYIEKTGLSFDPELYQVVSFRSRYLSGNPDGVFRLDFLVDSSWETYNHYGDILIDDGEFREIVMDMEDISEWAGGSEITAVRLYLPNNSDDDLVLEFDFFSIAKWGKQVAFGASTTGTLQRTTATWSGSAWDLDGGVGYETGKVWPIVEGVLAMLSEIVEVSPAAGTFTVNDQFGNPIPTTSRVDAFYVEA